MRIDAYSQVNKVYQTSNINNIKKTEETKKSDKIELSTQGQDYQLAKKVISDTPDVREDLVNSFKSQISSGDYQVNSDDVASKLIDNYKQVL